MAEYSNAAEREWGPQYDNLAYQPELVSRLQRTWPNSHKQTLFSGESNNDWDDLPRDYVPNSHNCKKFLVILGILLLVIGVAAGIVVAIYFSGQVGIAEKDETPEPQMKKVVAVVKLNETYVPALANMSSPEAQKMAEDFSKKMDEIYAKSTLADVYNGTIVTGFENGSVIVKYETLFIILVEKTTGKPSITIDVDIVINILQSNESKTTLSITSILEIEVVTVTTTVQPPTTAVQPTTTIVMPPETTAVMPPETTAVMPPETTAETVIILFTIKLNDAYQPALANMSSLEAKAKAKEIEEKFDKIFKNSSLADAFGNVTVTKFENGSLVVISELILIVPVDKDTGTPSINITSNQILNILLSNETKALLSITSILEVEVRTSDVATTTNILIPTTSHTSAISTTHDIPDSLQASSAPTSVEDTSSLSTTYQPDNITKLTATMDDSISKTSPLTTALLTEASTTETTSVDFTGTRESRASTTQSQISGTSTIQSPSVNFTTGTKISGTFTTQSPSINFTGTTFSVYRNTTQFTSHTWYSSSTSYMPSTESTTTTTPPDTCDLGLFLCSSNDQCIQENWFCDKFVDCKDGSDEDPIRCGLNDTEPTPEPKFPNGTELNCNFENPDQRLCKYQGSNGSYAWRIQQGSTPSNSTGPQFDHSYQDETGNYAFTESSYGNFMDNASLVSDFIKTDNETSSLSFYYHMYGQNMGSLSVYFDIRENGQMKRELKWTKIGDKGNYWMKACISIPANSVIRAHFTASRGRLHTSDIAIDDIKYSLEPCQKLPCMFDDSMCGKVVSPSGENPALYKWRTQRSVTMWNMAEKMGLLGDHTMGSKFARYMVANSSEGNNNDKTTYETPVLSNENNASLNFHYFINGNDVDKLTVNIRYGNSLESKTYSKNKENSWSWHHGCLPVAGNTGAVAEFIASHGSGPDGVIAVDDIVLLKSPSCDMITECEFGKDIFCGFTVSGDKYRWKMHKSIKGKFIEATGENREGLKTMLTSPVLPASSDSILLKYSMQGSVSLYINTMEKDANGKEITTTLWTGDSQVTPDMLNPSPPLNLENLLSTEVKETRNQNNEIDWMKVCVPLPSKSLAVQIVSLKRDVVRDFMALSYVGISDEKCKVGLMMTNCSFKEPNMCSYTIDCSINTQFTWDRVTGFRAKGSTGPQRDHTTNTTGGHFLQTDSSKGRPLDKAIVIFPNINVSETSSFRFYYYMYGSDIGSLQVNINDKMMFKETGEKTPFWNLGCVDLPLNTQVNVSFTATRGMGPLGDIAIDDISVLPYPCPSRGINCSFEDEMMCGYTNLPISQIDSKAMVDNQWFRSNLSMPDLSIFLKTPFGNEHHLLTRRPSRIRSPQMQFPTASCLQFSYFILMGKGTDITVTAIYEGSSKTEEKVFGIDNFTWADWRTAQMDLKNGSVATEFSVQPYDRKVMDTFFAIDNVKVIPNSCQPLVCSNVNLKKCSKGDVCIPRYKFCDKVKDCADGSDETGCTSFSKDIRLVNGIITGYEGRLEVLINGSWGTAYGLQWSEFNAYVACKQLGFMGYAQSIGYGKYHYGVGTMWRVKCFGNESKIQDCNLESIKNDAPHMSDVGLVCYNTTCETSKTPCPQSGNITTTYCLDEDQFCDGDYDCPDGYDEKNCSKCQKDEFYCKNKQCIPSSKYCDGLTDCKDASDEINCISKDAKGFVSVYHAGETLPVCVDARKSNDDIYGTVCMNTAQGVLAASLTGRNVSKGVMATYNITAKSVFGSYELSTVSSCTQARIQCNKPECGKQYISMPSAVTFVQYGTQALPREYPWQGLLLRNGKFICGVSVYTSRWFITAEHCVVEKGVQYKVAVGITKKENLPTATMYNVKSIVHHPNSAIKDGIPYSDIALLFLEEEVQFTNSIQPICLPSKVYTEHDDCYLTGWGRNENLITQDHLSEAKVKAVDNEECKKFYNIDISIICFKHNHPKMPSCYGDSGGPVVCRNNHGRFELVGVVSFGYPLCSAPNGTAAAFVNVLAMRGWITDETRCKLRCPNDNKCLYEPEICDGVSDCSDSSDEKSPYCSTSVSCNFGSPFKCGYSNVSSSPWYWASIFHQSPAISSQPSTGGDEETDEFMIAALNATKDKPALMESPVFSNIACISFLYIVHRNSSSQAVLNVMAKVDNSSAVLPIWNSNNSMNVILKSTPLHWKLARLHLPNNVRSIVFEAYYTDPNNSSFITVDDVQAQGKNCKQSCPENFYKCKNSECIKNSYRCDRSADCSDGSDEMDCDREPGLLT